MDFDAIDIHAFLRASVPKRFQDISPYDFEKFIAWLFRRDGYAVEETGYSGDFGADLLLTKSGNRTIVQVKRYAPGTQVSVGDINQVIGARTYYQVDDALVITTSDFSKPAIEIGRKAGIVMWNWDRLERYLGSVIPETGEEVFYSEELPDVNAEHADVFELVLLRQEEENIQYEGHDATLLHLELTNLRTENLTVHCELPVHVSKKSGRQTSAVAWKEHFFFHGMLVAESSVELACYFLKSQVPEIKRGDRLILKVRVAGKDKPVIVDEILRTSKHGCYVVSFVYGYGSHEYEAMIAFRDHVLHQSLAGRVFIRLYYRFSPALVRLAQGNRLIGCVITRLVHVFWSIFKVMHGQKRSTTDVSSGRPTRRG